MHWRDVFPEFTPRFCERDCKSWARLEVFWKALRLVKALSEVVRSWKTDERRPTLCSQLFALEDSCRDFSVDKTTLHQLSKDLGLITEQLYYSHGSPVSITFLFFPIDGRVTIRFVEFYCSNSTNSNLKIHAIEVNTPRYQFTYNLFINTWGKLVPQNSSSFLCKEFHEMGS